MKHRTWVIAVGEPLPSDSNEPRLLRAGIVAKMLAEAGHETVWWTSNFNHIAKRRRFENPTDLSPQPGLRVVLLDGVPYRRNISLPRIRNHRQIAAQFERRAESEPLPDVILCSFPTVELARAAVEFGRRHGIPVVIDVRDLWPDLVVELAPKGVRWLARIALHSMQRDTERAMTQATAIIGVTDEYRDWGVALARRPLDRSDRTFPLAYVTDLPDPALRESAEAFWRERGVFGNPEEFIVAFFGTIGHQFEFAPVIAAARQLQDRSPFRFVLCGDGETLTYYRRMAKGLHNVLFPGWISAPQIWSLMQHAKVGLAPYVDKENFRKNIPNKIIEYLSAGLPVVTSLKGAAERLLRTAECAYFYSNDSADTLADALRSALADRALLAIRSRNSRMLFSQSFAAQEVYGSLLEYLEELGKHARRS